MRSLRLPTLSRAPTLWLLGSALVWWLSLRTGSPLAVIPAGFAVYILACSGLYGLPLSLLITAMNRRPERGRIYRIVGDATLFLLGSTLAVVALIATLRLPTIPWQKALTQPEPMVELIVPLPSDSFAGGIIGRTETGALFHFEHRFLSAESRWVAIDALPGPPNPAKQWTLDCPDRHERAGGIIAPPAPRRVIDSASYKNCVVEGSLGTLFILTDDGALWIWDWSATLGEAGMALFAIPIAFLLGGLIALFWKHGSL